MFPKNKNKIKKYRFRVVYEYEMIINTKKIKTEKMIQLKSTRNVILSLIQSRYLKKYILFYFLYYYQ